MSKKLEKETIIRFDSKGVPPKEVRDKIRDHNKLITKADDLNSKGEKGSSKIFYEKTAEISLELGHIFKFNDAPAIAMDFFASSANCFRNCLEKDGENEGMIQIFAKIYVKQHCIDARSEHGIWKENGSVLVLASVGFGHAITLNIFDGLTHDIGKYIDEGDFLTNIFSYKTIVEALAEINDQHWVEIAPIEIPNGSSFIKSAIGSLPIK